MGSKETACTSCIHREVCAFKSDFMEAQSQVSMTIINCSDKNDDVRMIRLCDIPFIAPVDLKCLYYHREENKRYSDSTTTSTNPVDYILRG